MAWRLTVRAEHRVERSRFEDLPRALDALERRGRELGSVSRQPIDLKLRRFEPAQQVMARMELSGPERWFPSVQAGIDLHGDGSAEAFRGGIRRVELERGPGEDAFAVLRRALADVLEAAGTDAP